MSDLTFGELVTAQREKRGMSTDRLRHEMGFKTPSSISHLERQRNPKLSTIFKTAEALKVSPEALIPGLSDKPGAENEATPTPPSPGKEKKRFAFPVSKGFIILLVFGQILLTQFVAAHFGNSLSQNITASLFGMGDFYYPAEAKKEPGLARTCFDKLGHEDQMALNLAIFNYRKFVEDERSGGFKALKYKWDSTFYCSDWREYK